MEELYAYRQQIVDKARDQVRRLRAGLGQIDPEGIFTPLEDGGWSVHQVLVHMRDVEQHAFLPRVKNMLMHEQPELAYFDEGAWMEEHYDEHEPFVAVLSGFEQARTMLLEAVEGADPQGWSREGRHPTQGLRSVQWWFEYALRHTEEHLQQLSMD
jgi:hypothetical protein